MVNYKSFKGLLKDYKSKNWMDKLNNNDIKFFKIMNMDIDKDLFIHYKYFNKSIFKEAISYRAKTEFLVYIENLNRWAIPIKHYKNYLISFTDEKTNRPRVYSCKSKKEIKGQNKKWNGRTYNMFIVCKNKKRIALRVDYLILKYFVKYNNLRHLMY